MGITEEAFKQAKRVLQKCSTSHGMHASAGVHSYNMVFARDSMIGLIGASAADEQKEFKQQFALTLGTLAKNQSSSGQIPNAVDFWDNKRPKQATFATIDSTLWYLLGVRAFARNYKEKSIIKKHKPAIESAFCWLRCQDAGEDSLPEQLPTSDWQDCFPHKYGHTINSIALYYASLRAFGKNREAERVRKVATGRSKMDINLFSEEHGFFLPWQWKNHNGDREQEQWFDSLGNLLAVCGGFANKKQSETILSFIQENKINRPFPVRAIFPPIREHRPEWHSYFSKCLAAKPHYYLNGAIWPFIGGFHVAALVAAKQFDAAEHELVQLAKANRLGKKHRWEFNEWINPLSGRATGGTFHAWSAGAFLLAFKSLEKKKAVF